MASAASILLPLGASAAGAQASSALQAQQAYTQGTTLNTASVGAGTPQIIGVDKTVSVYFLENGAVYKSNASGIISTGILAATGSHLAVDLNGVIYVGTSSTSENGSAGQTPYLTRYTPSGAGYSPTTLLSGARNQVLGLAVDPAGNAFIAVVNGLYDYYSPTVQEVFAGTGNSANLVTLSTYITTFTVDSNDNLFFNYSGQDGVVGEIPRVNNAYSYSNYITPITAICHNTSGCSITALAADSNGNVYSSYVTDGNGGSERYLGTGNNNFSPGIVFTGQQSPYNIAVGPAGTVYTTDNSSNNIVLHVPPKAINFGSTGVDSQGGTATLQANVSFVLDASTAYGGVSYVSPSDTGAFGSLSTTPSCGNAACTSGTTYPAGTVITVPSSYTPGAAGTQYGTLNLKSTTATIASANLTGSGTGPLLSFLPAAASNITQTGNGPTLRTPSSVASDQSGNAYVIDTGLQQLLKVVPSSGQTTPLASNLNVNGANATAPALDAAGNVYFVQSDPAHSGLFEVSRVNTPDGGSSYTNTTVVRSSLTSPVGIAVDANGSLFVLDSSSNQVTAYLNINGSYLPRVILSNVTNARGLAVGTDGSLYIATTPGLLKSTPANGLYSSPTVITPSAATAYGVALDKLGNIYVNDAGNYVVLRLSPDARVVTTLYPSVNSTAIAVTQTGNVLLAQGSTSTLSLLRLDTAPSLAFAATAVGSTSTDSPQSITFFNTGNAALYGSNGNSTGVTGPFSLASGSTCPSAFNQTQVILAVNASCTYQVSFSPTTSGSASGSVQTKYYSKGGNGPLVTVTDALSGTGNAGTPTISVTNATQPYATNDTMLTATVSYNGPAPTGAVTFALNTPNPISATGQCQQTSDATLTCTGRPDVQQVPAGTYTITVREAADSSYAAATGTGTLTITKQTVSPNAFTAPSSVPYGSKNITFLSDTGFNSYNASAPTGNLNFTVDGTINVPSTCNGANPRECTANYNPSALSVGTHTLSATMAADTNYNSASSGSGTTFSITAGTLSGSVSPSTVVYGAASVQLNATFNYSGATPPTGPVSFTVNNGNAVQAQCTTSGSNRMCSATYTSSSLAAGSYTITATEAGDSNYSAGSATPNTLTVTPATPTGFVNSPTIAYGTNSVQLIASFNFTGSAAPTGPVTLTVNNATYNATCAAASTSPRQCSITFSTAGLAAGTYPVQASEAADGNYAAANGSGSLTISTTAPSIAVQSASAAYGASTAALTATINFTGSNPPTGQVTFTVNNGNAVQAQCTVNGSSRTCNANYPLQGLNGGTYVVQASEAADSNFGAANASGTLTVSTAAPTLATSNATAVFGSTTVQLVATQTFSGSAAPTGLTTFTVNNTTLVPANCTGAASPRSCTATFNPSSLGAGQYPVTVSEAADNNYSAATSPAATLTLTKATPAITANSASASYGAASTTLTALVRYAGTTSSTSPISFSIDGGAATVAGCSGTSPTLTCTASVPTASLSVGSHTITVSEPADSNYNAASGTATLTVAQGSTTLSVSAVSGSAGGSPVTLTATQTFSASAPTGQVSFLVNGTSVVATCTGTTSPRSCTASLDVSRLSSGTYNYTASSAADSNYTAATSNTAALTLSSSTVTLTLQPVTSTYGATPLNLTASLAFTGSSAPTGNTTFLVDGSIVVPAVCSGATSPQSCTGSYTGTPLTGGAHTVSASYAGDTTYSAATAAAVTITILPATPSVTVSSATAAFGAASTVLNATVTFVGPVAPTGSVRFVVDGASSTNAACSVANRVLTCTANVATGSLSVGTHNIAAALSGDTNYNAQTSPAATLTVSSATPAITVAAVLVPYGNTSVNLAATISASQATAPTGLVTFQVDGVSIGPAVCSNSGSIRTCTAVYNPASLAVGSHTLIASEAADTNYTAATSAISSLTVTKALPTVSVPAVVVPSGTSAATLTASVSFTGAAAPTGAVTFALTGNSSIPATCTPSTGVLNCAAAISLSSIPAGSYTLNASIAADGNYQPATAATTLVVSPGAASTFPVCKMTGIKSISSTSNAVSVTATCTDPGNLPVTTTINWGDGTAVGPAVNNGANTHTYASPATQTTYTIVLTGTNSAGSSGIATQDVIAVPTVALSSGSATVTASVTAQPASVPPLQVTFLCTSVSTNVSGQTVVNGLPSSYGITCSSPTVSSTAVGPAQVTINTTTGLVAKLTHPELTGVMEALLLPLLGLPFAALGGRRGKLVALAIVSLGIATAGMSGCGGSFNAPSTATPKGKYYITITETPVAGTAVPTGFVQSSLIVPLTVQ